jgi:hypothetical protein
MPHVDVVERSGSSAGEGIRIVEYHTPVGVVRERFSMRGVGTRTFIHEYSWNGMTPWRIEHAIKNREDYEVLKFMIEDTVYKPCYEAIRLAQRWVGDDGIVMTLLPYSPLQIMMISWVGIPTFYIHFTKYREKVEELYRAFDKKYEELYPIAADSPADLILYGDNLDGTLVSPPLFERYFLPAYEKCARVLHEKGKFMGSHFDGRLGILAELIAKSPQDVIEAFHPPPLGDLPLNQALSLWKDKVIFMSYPGSVYALGPEAVKEHLLKVLESAIPGDRLVVFASSETSVPEDCLLALTSIMEKATLPLSRETIEKIRNSLS